MSRIANLFVEPLSSDHRGFRRYRSFIIIIILIIPSYGAAKAHSFVALLYETTRTHADAYPAFYKERIQEDKYKQRGVRTSTTGCPGTTRQGGIFNTRGGRGNEVKTRKWMLLHQKTRKNDPALGQRRKQQTAREVRQHPVGEKALGETMGEERNTRLVGSTHPAIYIPHNRHDTLT